MATVSQTKHAILLCFVWIFFTKLRDQRCYYSICELMNHMPQLSSWCRRRCGCVGCLCWLDGRDDTALWTSSWEQGSNGIVFFSSIATLRCLRIYSLGPRVIPQCDLSEQRNFKSCSWAVWKRHSLGRASCATPVNTSCPNFCLVEWIFLSFAGSFRRWQSLLKQLQWQNQVQYAAMNNGFGVW